MSKYAIIQIGPFQYNVEEGKEYSVPKFVAEAGKTLEIKEVLAVANGNKFTVGKPHVDGATVKLEIVEQGLGEKVVSRIFKAKSRYRKTKGFRKEETTFKVVSIK